MGAKVLEKMAPKSKRDMKRWQGQEKEKLRAIVVAFSVQTDEKIEVISQESAATGGDK